jgi:hypothetical protein
MKRWLTTTLAVLLCSAVLRADITVVQTTTVEGGMAAMAAQSGANMTPKMTTRIKGMKSRIEMDAGPASVVTIVDLVAKQVIVLHTDQKTASIVSGATPPAAPPAGAAPAPKVTLPAVEGTIKPTGKSQVIDGIKCDEYTFSTAMNFSEMSGPQVPPEAAAMMQGMKMLMSGSLWVAKAVPGAEEYVAFQKATAASDLASAAMSASGMKVPGMEKLMNAIADVDGVTYLSEMTMNVEGTGPIADMMKQMGAMKITSKVHSITSGALADDLFRVPEGYTVIK